MAEVNWLDRLNQGARRYLGPHGTEAAARDSANILAGLAGGGLVVRSVFDEENE